jgi:hypothetical protein
MSAFPNQQLSLGCVPPYLFPFNLPVISPLLPLFLLPCIRPKQAVKCEILRI